MFGSSFLINWSTYENQSETIDGKLYKYTINSPTRMFSHGLLVASTSIVITPIFVIGVSSTMVALSVGMIYILGQFALNRVKDSSLRWQTPLHTGILCMVGTSLLGIGSQLVIISSSTFPIVYLSFVPCIGIALYSAITSYNIHSSIIKYENDDDADHLGSAAEFYIYFVNRLIRFIEILGRMKKSEITGED